MKVPRHLQSVEWNYGLIRVGVALLMVAVVYLSAEPFIAAPKANACSLAFLVYGLLLLGLQVSLKKPPLKLEDSALIDAVFISSAIIADGTVGYLAALPLLIIPAAWFVNRRAMTSLIGYHLMGVCIAWLVSNWHLPPELQVLAALYVVATLIVAAQASEHYQSAETIGASDAATPKANPAMVPTAPPATNSPESSEPPPSAAQDLHLLLGRNSQANNLIEQLSQWGLKSHIFDELAEFVANTYRRAELARPPQTLLLDLRGRTESPHELLQLFRNSRLLRNQKVIAITNLNPEDAKQLHQQQAFDAVLSSPLDKTLLFNALNSRPTLTEQDSTVTALIDRYVKGKVHLPPLEILVALQNRTQLKLVKHQLEKYGHHVYTTTTGEQALDAMTDHTFDAALMDTQLADMDGFEIVSIYRLTHPRLSSSPLIIVAPDITTEIRQRSDEAGADDLITLPQSTEKLNQTLARVIQTEKEPDITLGSQEIGTIADDHNVPRIDRTALRELERLGNGLPFVQELVDNFIADSKSLLNEMQEAIASKDLDRFQNCAHSVKGSAGSVGAPRLQEMGIRLAKISSQDFARNSTWLISTLAEEMQATHQGLADYTQERSQQESKG